EELVRAVAGERDSHVTPGHLGQVPDWQSARVRAGLVRIIGDFLDDSGEIGPRVQIEFIVVSAVGLRDFPKILTLVKRAALERYRKRLQPSPRRFAGVVQDRGGI